MARAHPSLLSDLGLWDPAFSPLRPGSSDGQLWRCGVKEEILCWDLPCVSEGACRSPSVPWWKSLGGIQQKRQMLLLFDPQEA